MSNIIPFRKFAVQQVTDSHLRLSEIPGKNLTKLLFLLNLVMDLKEIEDAR